jgi:hypothetical protein
MLGCQPAAIGIADDAVEQELMVRLSEGPYITAAMRSPGS